MDKTPDNQSDPADLPVPFSNLDPHPPVTTPVPRKRKLDWVRVISWGIAVIGSIIGGLFTHTIPFAAATIGCGKLPVVASDFMAGYDFILPGERFYGPSPLDSRYFCSRQAAEKAGYHHSLATVAGAKEDQDIWNKYLEGRKFQASKVSFQALSPSYLPARFTKDDPEVDHGDVLQEFETNTYMMGHFRQAIDSPTAADWPCRTNTCTVIGISQGRQVYKTHAGNGNSFWGVKLGQTYFEVVGQARANLTDQEAFQMLNSLQPIAAK